MCVLFTFDVGGVRNISRTIEIFNRADVALVTAHLPIESYLRECQCQCSVGVAMAQDVELGNQDVGCRDVGNGMSYFARYVKSLLQRRLPTLTFDELGPRRYPSRNLTIILFFTLIFIVHQLTKNYSLMNL